MQYYSGNSGERRENGSYDHDLRLWHVGILVSILSQVLKHSGRDEQAFMVSLAGLLIVLFWIVPYIYELFQNIQKLFVI